MLYEALKVNYYWGELQLSWLHVRGVQRHWPVTVWPWTGTFPYEPLCLPLWGLTGTSYLGGQSHWASWALCLRHLESMDGLIIAVDRMIKVLLCVSTANYSSVCRSYCSQWNAANSFKGTTAFRFCHHYFSVEQYKNYIYYLYILEDSLSSNFSLKFEFYGTSRSLQSQSKSHWLQFQNGLYVNYGSRLQNYSRNDWLSHWSWQRGANWFILERVSKRSFQ